LAAVLKTYQERMRRDRVGGTTCLTRRDMALSLGRWTLCAVGLGLLGGCQLPNPLGETGARGRRIGYLFSGTRTANQPWTDAFLDQLRQHGWVEGENLTIEWRFADGRNELLPGLAAELVSLGVEVLAVVGIAAVPARQQTSTIPIVMINISDPVGEGLVQSLVRPGGNATGVRDGIAAMAVKGVELLKTVAPRLARLAILADSRNPNHGLFPSTATQTALSLGLESRSVDVQTVEDVDNAFQMMRAWSADGLILEGIGTYVSGVNARVVELAAEHRVPAMFQTAVVVKENGGLMAYASNFPSTYRLGADYVDKVLHAAAPADLPVVDPRQFDFIVNTKTARELGITFPPDAAAQVTQWVE
jgi:putative ABC transport system substrate-binding protein